MARTHTRLLVVGLLAVLAGAGCSLETEEFNAPAFPNRATTVVINEVFVLPPNDPNYFCWVELYNPADATTDTAVFNRTTVDLRGWTLEYTTVRVVQSSLLEKGIVIDSSVTPPESVVVYIGRDTLGFGGFQVGRFPVQFARGLNPPSLPPGSFAVLVTDRSRMEIFTALGPGSGPEVESQQAFFERPETTFVPVLPGFGNINVPDTVRQVLYPWALGPTDQLILRNAQGTIVDVVRYGNYRIQPTDPEQGNASFGAITPFESIARFSGGYKSGSTTNDFYMTNGRSLPPIPRYFSQRSK